MVHQCNSSNFINRYVKLHHYYWTLDGHVSSMSDSVCCYQYQRMKTSKLESWRQKYSLPLFTILNDGLGSWKSTMDRCHVQRCFPIFTLEKKKKSPVYLGPVTAINQNCQNPSKQQKGHFFFSLYTPSFKSFLCTFATQMLAMTSAWHGKLFTRAALSHSSSCKWQLRDAHSLTLMSLR